MGEKETELVITVAESRRDALAQWSSTDEERFLAARRGGKRVRGGKETGYVGAVKTEKGASWDETEGAGGRERVRETRSERPARTSRPVEGGRRDWVMSEAP